MTYGSIIAKEPRICQASINCVLLILSSILKGVKRMRASGKLAAQVLEFAGTLVKPGVTTDAIDKVCSTTETSIMHLNIRCSDLDGKLIRPVSFQAVHKMIIDSGAYPSPLNYGGFPKSVCTSVNECVCHGIPDDRPLEDGDIVNVGMTIFHQNMPLNHFEPKPP